jgi:hypothetical protein
MNPPLRQLELLYNQQLSERCGFQREIAGNAAEIPSIFGLSDERQQAYLGHMGSFHGHVGAPEHPPRP